MQAVRIAGFGLEQIAIDEVPDPVPAPGQVLLRVRAASLNFRDVLVARGDYNRSYPLPLVLGSDAVGEIVAFGPNTAPSGFSLGERVCPIFAQGWVDGPPLRATMRNTLGGPLPGVFAELALARVDSIVRVPDYLDDREAASLPCAAVTAYSALRVLGTLRAGETLLTLGSGGVSSFGIQLARLLGARVIATTRRPEKQERLRELGADTVLVTTAPGWGKRVRDLAGGEGVDHVLEVGGAGTLGESLLAVRPGGTVSLIGVLSGGDESAATLTPVIMRNIRVQGVFVGHQRAFEELLAAFSAHQVRPAVDCVFPLERARDAFEHLIAAKHVGKVCIEPRAFTRGPILGR
jgi:NADPH:quinone reductase-like Zn-dependent oxidoreductase